MGPSYDFLSAPLWLITVLHIVTLTLHFVAMNFLFGGVMVILFAKFDNRWSHETVRKFVRLFPTAMAATITLGVAPLLFVQLTYSKLIYSASIVSGWWWLGIVAMAIVVYYLLYSAAFSKNATTGSIKIFLVLALLGMVYISLTYSSIFSMTEKPDLIANLYSQNQSGWTYNPAIGDYIVRWLHMILGALTVGGFFVGWLGRDNSQAYETGKMVYLWGMVAAMVAGLAYLLHLTEILVPFMRTPAVWFLLASIVLSAASLHLFFKRKFWYAGVTLLLSMIGMVTIRHYVRVLHLDPTWDPATMPMKPQWSVFILFLLCFVVAIAAVWFMIRLFFQDRAAKSTAGA